MTDENQVATFERDIINNTQPRQFEYLSDGVGYRKGKIQSKKVSYQEGLSMSVLSHSVHTGLFVEVVEKMVQFYRDILGFETNWDGGPFAEFKVIDGGLFMFDRKQFAEAMDQPYKPTNGVNLTMEIGIGVPTKADVDREYARLMALGVHSAQEPKTQPWGQRNFWITDPEGNYIEVGSFQD